MAATTGLYAAPRRTEAQSTTASDRKRRLINRQSGRALEILGHAIEYLTDEYVKAPVVSARDPQLEAIQILMAVNRQVYCECPFVPTIGERLRALFE